MGMKAHMLEAAVHDMFIHAADHANSLSGKDLMGFMLRELMGYDVMSEESMTSMVGEWKELLCGCGCEDQKAAWHE